MDPATMYALGSVGGSLLGDMLGGDDAEARRRAIQKLMAEAGPSALEGMEADPYTKDQQLRALASMAERARSGGWDAQSKAAYEEAQSQADAANRGQQGAITQNFAARGQGGSGAEFVARLQGAQGYQNQARMAGTRAAGDASTRALQALSESGRMAGTARGQDWGERTDVAGARDTMARFNAGQRVKKAGMEADLYGEEAQRKRDMGLGLGKGVGAMF